MKVEKIGLLGFGTVGSGVYHILTKNQAAIEKKTGVSLQIEKALVKEPELFADKISGITFTSDVDYILNDEEISIIVEVLGGVDFAFNCVKKALESGKHVVTANKDLLAKHGVELSQIARENNVYLYYEASVGGGIPVLRPLVEHVSSNEVEAIYGIVNGTTNFILTSMSQQGLSYEEVLKTAQEKGFAEADPTSDVEGHDAAYKLMILTRLAFGVNVTFDEVAKTGISGVTTAHMKMASENGYAIKLLAKALSDGEKVSLEVAPTFVPATHLLAQVHYENNAISVKGNAVDEVLFYGKGAGSLPTATSVLADVVEVVRRKGNGSAVETFGRVESPLVEFSPEAATSSYFVYGKGNLEVAPLGGEVVSNNQEGFGVRYTALTASELAKVKEAFAHLNEVAIYPILEEA